MSTYTTFFKSQQLLNLYNNTVNILQDNPDNELKVFMNEGGVSLTLKGVDYESMRPVTVSVFFSFDGQAKYMDTTLDIKSMELHQACKILTANHG